MTKKHSQIALIILDGWGHREDKNHNAIADAKTPFFDYLWQTYPHSLLMAGEEHVGLPSGQFGNSEIGHTTIGAGKVIDTDLVRIRKAMDNGDYENNEVFKDLFGHIKENDSTLHVMGLVGKGGVHSHVDHLIEFIRIVKKKGITKLVIHAFTDGRDAPPQEAVKDIEEIQEVLDEEGIGKIATVSGRYYAMDRDNNWDRLAKVESLLFECDGPVCEIEPKLKVAEIHKDGKTDEHIEPILFEKAPIQKNDGIFFFNFRADRARMISKKILERKGDLNLFFATMTDYGSEIDSKVAFPSSQIEATIASEISKAGLRQAHIAETEKFPHATYFLNGGKEDTHDGEEHVMLPSRKDVATHDEAPEMKAKEIADEAIKRIGDGVEFIFINFANPDMVGHTANKEAIIIAVETVDRELKRVVDALFKKGGVAFVTADHGNAEINIEEKTGEKHTSHTLSPVPAILTDSEYCMKDGGLADIAPTILEILEIPKPNVMTGQSLIS